MERFRCWILAGLLAVLPACSLHHSTVVLQPVGPPPPVEIDSSPEGYLVVYSAWDPFSDYLSRVVHRSDYDIAPVAGGPSRRIQNSQDRFDEGPVRVALEPGSYHVTARSVHDGKVTVPVVIQEHQTTTVWLDGAAHVEAAPGSATNVVKLPDGRVIGWAASPAGK